MLVVDSSMPWRDLSMRQREPLRAKTRRAGKSRRLLQDSNLCGGTPIDFESIALTARPNRHGSKGHFDCSVGCIEGISVYINLKSELRTRDTLCRLDLSSQPLKSTSTCRQCPCPQPRSAARPVRRRRPLRSPRAPATSPGASRAVC